jgi:hypothetical protein
MANYRFGKHQAKIDYRTLRFMDYVKSTLGAPPPRSMRYQRFTGN